MKKGNDIQTKKKEKKSSEKVRQKKKSENKKQGVKLQARLAGAEDGPPVGSERKGGVDLSWSQRGYSIVAGRTAGYPG